MTEIKVEKPSEEKLKELEGELRQKLQH